jgi:murein DD-endopeptidase MepM/ murein hydrolase activator NlpD
MTVSNAPAAGADRTLSTYKPFAVAAPGVLLAISPVNGACLTSGFGPRAGGLHKGVDLQSKPANMVHAAAAGRILEAGVRADYGNYVLIDHGQGVFTRYAHLAAIEPGVTVGAQAPFGTALGVMGATAGYSIPVHLHFEVLTGDINTQKKSFGLTPVDILSLPRSG